MSQGMCQKMARAFADHAHCVAKAGQKPRCITCKFSKLRSKDTHAACAWQGAPRDVFAAHLASLPSTQAVLAALQRGFSARQRMLAKSPPVKVETLPLHSLENRPILLPGFAWSYHYVECVMFSPSGRYLAAVVEHRQKSTELEEVESDMSEDYGTSNSLDGTEVHKVWTYEVLVYEASEGFKQCARFDCQGRQAVIQWSPTSDLCVAQLLLVGNSLCTAQEISRVADMSWNTAAFIYRPGSSWAAAHGGIAPCLSDQATEELSTLGKACQVHSCWSPSGRYLLVHGVDLCEYGRADAWGWLAIADVEKGGVVAQSKLRTRSNRIKVERLSFAWHPSSRAVITSGDVEIQDMAAIRRAGFGIGKLPGRLCMHQAGFSADASMLIAKSPVYVDDHLLFFHLECTLTGLQICLGQPQVLAPSTGHDESFVVGWLPGANTVLMQRDDTGTVMLSHVGCQNVLSSGSAASMSDRISSSGNVFLMADSQDEPATSIAEVQSGQLLWEPRTYDLSWPAMHELLEGSAPHFLPTWLVCHAWAPTGVGPVCSLPGRDETAGGGGYLPPALHFYMFA